MRQPAEVRLSRRAVAAAAMLAAPGCATARTSEAPMRLFLFQYGPGPAWRSGAPMREQGLGPHAAYMQMLQDEERLFAAGGYVNADGGMAIVRAADLEEASAMLAADPAIASGVFIAALREWQPRFRTDQALPAGG